MSPRTSLFWGVLRRTLLPVGLLLALLATVVAAQPELDVSGTVLATAPRLRVRLVVTNRGAQAARALDIVGELLGQRSEARLPGGIAPGSSGETVLDFDATGARPGVHVLTLLLEHPLPGALDAAGNPPLASRRAWLLVALTANAAPAVRLTPRPLRLDVSGRLEVAVESTDGAAHRLSLRAWPARGLRSDGGPVALDVPARGSLQTTLPLVRAGAPRGTRHAVLLVAEAEDGPLARASVATATVDIAADPSLLPRWRGTVLALALVLLGIALAADAWLYARRTT